MIKVKMRVWFDWLDGRGMSVPFTSLSATLFILCVTKTALLPTLTELVQSLNTPYSAALSLPLFFNACTLHNFLHFEFGFGRSEVALSIYDHRTQLQINFHASFKHFPLALLT